MAVQRYDLTGRFTPQSFEDLLKALLVELCGAKLEVFGPGPDGGRDALYRGELRLSPHEPPWNGTTVFQFKFRAQPDNDPAKDARWLIKEVRQEFAAYENPANCREKPDYYVLVSNIALSGVAGAGGKDKLDALLADMAEELGIRACQVWDYHKLSTLLDSAPATRQSHRHLLNLADLLEKQDSQHRQLLGKHAQTHRLLQEALGVEGLSYAEEWFKNWPEDGALRNPEAPPMDRLIYSYVERPVDRTVREKLQAGAWVGVTGFVGMGGIGKTFLAMRLAREFADGGGYVVWVGLLRSSLENALDAFAGCFKLEFRHGLDAQRKLSALQRLLELHRSRQTRLLVVLDNAERFQDLEHLLDLCQGLPVLVTSRRHEAADRVDYQSIEAMSGEEAESLCRAVLDRKEKSYGGYRALAKEDCLALAGLCQDLGGHPLGIRLALCSLLRDRSAGRAVRLRSRIQKGPIEQLYDEESADASALHASVQTTFDLLYQDLPQAEGEKGLHAKLLLPLIAALAPAPLSRQEAATGLQALCAELRSAPVASPPAWETDLHALNEAPDALHTAIDTLLDNALLDLDQQAEGAPDKLKAHPLLREYAFHSLKSAATEPSDTSHPGARLRGPHGPTPLALTNAVLRCAARLEEAVEIHLDLMPRLRRQTELFTAYWKKLDDLARREVFITGRWNEAVRLREGFYQSVQGQGFPDLEARALGALGDRLMRMEDPRGWKCLQDAIALWRSTADVLPFRGGGDLAWYQALAWSWQDQPAPEDARRQAQKLLATGLALPDFVGNSVTLGDLADTVAAQSAWCAGPWAMGVWGIASPLHSNHVYELAGLLWGDERLDGAQLQRTQACYQTILVQRTDHEDDYVFHVTPQQKIAFRSGYALQGWRLGQWDEAAVEQEFAALAALAQRAGFRGHGIQQKRLAWRWEQALRAGQWRSAGELAGQAAEAALAAEPHQPYRAAVTYRCQQLLCRLADSSEDTAPLAPAVAELRRDILDKRDKYTLPWLWLAQALLGVRQHQPESAVRAAACARTAFRDVRGGVPWSAEYFFTYVRQQVDAAGPCFEALRDVLSPDAIAPWRELPLLRWRDLPQRVRCTTDGRSMRLVQGGWQAGPPPMQANGKACDVALYPFYIDEAPWQLPGAEGTPRWLASYSEASDLAAQAGKRLPNRAEWAAWVWQHCLGNQPLAEPSAEDLLRRLEARIHQGETLAYPFPQDFAGPNVPSSRPADEAAWIAMRMAWLENSGWLEQLAGAEAVPELLAPLQQRADLNEALRQALRLGLLNTLSLNFAETRRLLEQLSLLPVENLAAMAEAFATERKRLRSEVAPMNDALLSALRARSTKWLALAAGLDESAGSGADIQHFWLLSPEQLKEQRLCANVVAFLDQGEVRHWPLAENLVSVTVVAEVNSAALRCVRPVFRLEDLADLQSLENAATEKQLYAEFLKTQQTRPPSTEEDATVTKPAAEERPVAVSAGVPTNQVAAQSPLSPEDELKETDFITSGADHAFILELLMPPHPQTIFNERLFMELLTSSISLTGQEKQRIVDSIPQLNQYQIDELMRIFVEEASTFVALKAKRLGPIWQITTETHATLLQAMQLPNPDTPKEPPP